MNADATTIPSSDETGFYREYAPPAALRDHFRCVWINRAAADRGGPVDVVPDGCVDLLWRNGRLLVAGPDITVARPILAAGSVVLGARFHAGAAVRWLGLPMSEIVGRTVELADIWDASRLGDLVGRLGDAPTTVQAARQLLGGLSAVATDVEAPDSVARRIFAWLGEGLGTAEPIAVLRDRLDMSERTLLRRSREHFGYGPKTLDRILRFQRFQALALQSTSVHLASLAAEAGFADQAHLNREVQSLCGVSAGAFVRRLAG